MAGSLSLGGNTIATHTGPKGTGTVSLSTTQLSTTQLNGMDVVKADTNTDPFGDSSQIRFYNFQDGATDVMGNSNGTLKNANISVSSIVHDLSNEKNIYFDGTSYMTIPAINTTTFSVSFWIRGFNFDNVGFIGIFGNQANPYGQIATYPTLKLYRDAEYAFTTSTTLANDVLHHLVWTANSGVDLMYLNNVSIGTSGVTVGLNATLYVGTASTQAGSATYAPKAYYRNIRIFNKQLSAAEVNTLYTGKL